MTASVAKTGGADRSREAALRVYFRAPAASSGAPKSFGLLAVAALLLLVSLSMLGGNGTSAQGCALFFALPALSLAAWALGRMWRARKRARRELAARANGPGDQQVQAWLEQSLAKVKEESLSQLGLSDGELFADPLAIVAPVLWSTEGIRQDDLLFRIGADGVSRFGVYSVTMIALTDNHLGFALCEYSFVRDQMCNIKTCEYLYRNIVAVTTDEHASTLLLPSGKPLDAVREFRVSVPSGEAIRVTIDASGLRRWIGTDALPESGSEKAVRAIRTMLRQRNV